MQRRDTLCGPFECFIAVFLIASLSSSGDAISSPTLSKGITPTLVTLAPSASPESKSEQLSTTLSINGASSLSKVSSRSRTSSVDSASTPAYDGSSQSLLSSIAKVAPNTTAQAINPTSTAMALQSASRTSGAAEKLQTFSASTPQAVITTSASKVSLSSEGSLQAVNTTSAKVPSNSAVPTQAVNATSALKVSLSSTVSVQASSTTNAEVTSNSTVSAQTVNATSTPKMSPSSAVSVQAVNTTSAEVTSKSTVSVQAANTTSVSKVAPKSTVSVLAVSATGAELALKSTMSTSQAVNTTSASKVYPKSKVTASQAVIATRASKVSSKSTVSAQAVNTTSASKVSTKSTVSLQAANATSASKVSTKSTVSAQAANATSASKVYPNSTVATPAVSAISPEVVSKPTMSTSQAINATSALKVSPNSTMVKSQVINVTTVTMVAPNSTMAKSQAVSVTSSGLNVSSKSAMVTSESVSVTSKAVNVAQNSTASSLIKATVVASSAGVVSQTLAHSSKGSTSMAVERSVASSGRSTVTSSKVPERKSPTILPSLSSLLGSSIPLPQETTRSKPSTQGMQTYGFIVSSYTTPCYIYHVVEQTFIPMATANHSAEVATPTVDLGSVSIPPTHLPSVTLKPSFAMTTKAAQSSQSYQSQVHSSNIQAGSSFLVAMSSQTVLIGSTDVLVASSNVQTRSSPLQPVSELTVPMERSSLSAVSPSASKGGSSAAFPSVLQRGSITATPSVSQGGSGAILPSTFQAGSSAASVSRAGSSATSSPQAVSSGPSPSASQAGSSAASPLVSQAGSNATSTPQARSSAASPLASQAGSRAASPLFSQAGSNATSTPQARSSAASPSASQALSSAASPPVSQAGSSVASASQVGSKAVSSATSPHAGFSATSASASKAMSSAASPPYTGSSAASVSQGVSSAASPPHAGSSAASTSKAMSSAASPPYAGSSAASVSRGVSSAASPSASQQVSSATSPPHAGSSAASTSKAMSSAASPPYAGSSASSPSASQRLSNAASPSTAQAGFSGASQSQARSNAALLSQVGSSAASLSEAGSSTTSPSASLAVTSAVFPPSAPRATFPSASQAAFSVPSLQGGSTAASSFASQAGYSAGSPSTVQAQPSATSWSASQALPSSASPSPASPSTGHVSSNIPAPVSASYFSKETSPLSYVSSSTDHVGSTRNSLLTSVAATTPSTTSQTPSGGGARRRRRREALLISGPTQTAQAGNTPSTRHVSSASTVASSDISTTSYRVASNSPNGIYLILSVTPSSYNTSNKVSVTSSLTPSINNTLNIVTGTLNGTPSSTNSSGESLATSRTTSFGSSITFTGAVAAASLSSSITSRVDNGIHVSMSSVSSVASVSSNTKLLTSSTGIAYTASIKHSTVSASLKESLTDAITTSTPAAKSMNTSKISVIVTSVTEASAASTGSKDVTAATAFTLSTVRSPHVSSSLSPSPSGRASVSMVSSLIDTLSDTSTSSFPRLVSFSSEVRASGMITSKSSLHTESSSMRLQMSVNISQVTVISTVNVSSTPVQFASTPSSVSVESATTTDSVSRSEAMLSRTSAPSSVVLKSPSVSPQSSEPIMSDTDRQSTVAAANSATQQFSVQPSSKAVGFTPLVSSLPFAPSTTESATETVLGSVVSKATDSVHVGMSSSSARAPSFVTMSSLGICYVVFTTKIVQPSPTPTSTISVDINATSIQIEPTVNGTSPVSSSAMLTSSAPVSLGVTASAVGSLSSSAVQSEISRASVVVNATTSTSSAVRLTVSPVFSPSVASADTSSPSQSVLSVTPTIQTSSAVVVKSVTTKVSSSSSTKTALLTTKEVPVSMTTVATSSPVSPTQASSVVVKATSSVPTTPAPTPKELEDFLLYMEISVPTNESVSTSEFKGKLEDGLVTAYDSGKTRARRRRAAQNLKATIHKIERPQENETVNVQFYMSENSKNVLADDAADTFDKLSTQKLGGYLKYKVITVPNVLVVHSLVSMIIKTTANKNISNPENKDLLERNLGEYYQAKKKVEAAAKITRIVHESNDVTYLEFYVTVNNKEVNRTVVVEAFKVDHVNILTAELNFQVLTAPYIRGVNPAPEEAYVKLDVYASKDQNLEDASFREKLSEGLVEVYQKGKEEGKSRRKRRATGSTSATIVNVVRKSDKAAEVTFAIFEFGKAVDASTTAAVMNRLDTSEMSLLIGYPVATRPEAVMPTDESPSTASDPVRYWIIAAVIAPILLIIIIILLIYWRWKKGAPQKRIEPEAGLKGGNAMKMQPTRTSEVARPNLYAEGPAMKTTSFASRTPYEVDEEQPVRRETSLRRKVGKTPARKALAREMSRRAQEESEEEADDSFVSVSQQGSTEHLIRAQPGPGMKSDPGRPPVAKKRVPAKELEDDESESEGSEEESATEAESVATTRTDQTRHSAAQVPTVAVMGEASGPPRYPPVRFRSSVHPSPSLPPLDIKQTSLVGVRVEPPSDQEDRLKHKRKPTRQELKQKSEIERLRNKRRLRSRRRGKVTPSQDLADSHSERKAWAQAQHQIDDVLEANEDGLTRKEPRRVKRPHHRSVSTVATDDDSVQLQSYKQIRSPHGTMGRDEEPDMEESSGSESEIGMDETRERMHALLDDAFTLFGPLSKKLQKERDRPEPPQSQGPRQFARPPVPARFAGSQPALPEPPPPHGRATEPTPRQRSRAAAQMPGHYQGFPPQFVKGVPGYPVRTPAPPLVTRDPVVVWDPLERERYLRQHAPLPSFSYQDAAGQNVYITPVAQQRDEAGGLVWSPYAAEDAMDSLYPGLTQGSYPGALGTSPPKDSSFLSDLQNSPFDSTFRSRNTTLDMSGAAGGGQRNIPLGKSPQPLIRSIKDELMRLSQSPSRKTPITEI